MGKSLVSCFFETQCSMIAPPHHPPNMEELTARIPLLIGQSASPYAEVTGVWGFEAKNTIFHVLQNTQPELVQLCIRHKYQSDRELFIVSLTPYHCTTMPPILTGLQRLHYTLSMMLQLSVWKKRR